MELENNITRHALVLVGSDVCIAELDLRSAHLALDQFGIVAHTGFTLGVRDWVIGILVTCGKSIEGNIDEDYVEYNADNITSRIEQYWFYHDEPFVRPSSFNDIENRIEDPIEIENGYIMRFNAAADKLRIFRKSFSPKIIKAEA